MSYFLYEILYIYCVPLTRQHCQMLPHRQRSDWSIMDGTKDLELVPTKIWASIVYDKHEKLYTIFSHDRINGAMVSDPDKDQAKEKFEKAMFTPHLQLEILYTLIKL